MEFRFWLFGSKLDHIHLIQLFLTGHCHITGGYTCLVPGNEILQVGNFLLLLIIGSFKLGFLHGINFLELIIISGIAVQLLVIHMIN